jgi:hypothetical protein
VGAADAVVFAIEGKATGEGEEEIEERLAL